MLYVHIWRSRFSSSTSNPTNVSEFSYVISHVLSCFSLGHIFINGEHKSSDFIRLSDTFIGSVKSQNLSGAQNEP